MQPYKLRKGKDPTELGLPLTTISVDLTENCSLRCEYCFCDTEVKKSSIHGGRDLTIETGKEIIDWFISKEVSADEKEIRIEWWGGEPFMKFKTMKALTEYAIEQSKQVKKNISFSATTNMINLTEEILEWTVKNRVELLFSIDGRDKRNRKRKLPNGKNSWSILKEKVILITEIYTKHKVPPSYRITVTPGVIKGLTDDIKWLYDTMPMASVMFSADYDSKWREKDFVQYEKELDKLIDLKLADLRNGKYIPTRPFEHDFKAHLFKMLGLPGSIKENNCGAGRQYMAVSVEGALYPCHRNNKHNTLDISWDQKERNLGSIYEGVVNVDLIKTIREELTHPLLNKSSKMEHCKKCEIRTTCLGQCFAVIKDITGKWNGESDKLCRIRKLVNKAAKKMILKIIENDMMHILLGITKWVEMIKTEGNPIPICSCYASVYVDKSEFIRHKSITDKEAKDPYMGLLVIARDIISEELEIHANATRQPPQCLIYRSAGSIAKHTDKLTTEKKKNILKKLTDLYDVSRQTVGEK